MRGHQRPCSKTKKVSRVAGKLAKGIPFAAALAARATRRVPSEMTETATFAAGMA